MRCSSPLWPATAPHGDAEHDVLPTKASWDEHVTDQKAAAQALLIPTLLFTFAHAGQEAPQ